MNEKEPVRKTCVPLNDVEKPPRWPDRCRTSVVVGDGTFPALPNPVWSYPSNGASVKIQRSGEMTCAGSVVTGRFCGGGGSCARALVATSSKAPTQTEAIFSIRMAHYTP